MKRNSHLFEQVISDENLLRAIKEVNRTHRWCHYPTKPNRTVLWVETTTVERVKELRQILLDGFENSPVKIKRRYDSNARKWREICEPKLWPDQYIHHAMIQVLEPVMMRGMDHWCCGSIKRRGAHYGVKAIKKWMRDDPKGTRWCAQLDIRHFYDSLQPERVMERMKRLVKDNRMLDLIWRCIKDGVRIGAYTSQWFANTYLQPLDILIRVLEAKHYLRYMDNFTVFTKDKKTISRIIREISRWLHTHGLAMKHDWQKFRTKYRKPDALGYRYGRGFTLLRKHCLLSLKRRLRQYDRMRKCGHPISLKFAQGLLSRLGMLRHCNSTGLYKRYVRKHLQRKLKDIVRAYQKEVNTTWSMYLERYEGTLQSSKT